MARSAAFAMTEPAVASSDATNIELRMDRNGDGYLLNGRRWFASNAVHANCRVLIVMGRTDPSAAPHRQQSMVVVPIDASGIRIVRSLPMFGYQDREGHAEIEFENEQVPARDLLKGEGEGFAIGQARTTFGSALSERANIRDWIAEARIEIEKSRLLILKAA
jgi:acyl-CoA dehydrogenase